MSMIIANNLPAVNTRRQFDISGRAMSSAMEKLSSGYRINTGKDDPSGLLISEKLRAQLNGLQRAQQNTEEAINVMGIAEGALNEMNSILKKMKSLAIHSANTGVTSPDQIAADQAEMDSAIQTLDRIAQTTRFSGENLLNGAKDIAYSQDTLIKGTQQNSLINVRESRFTQIYKRDDYNVSLNFTGTTNADNLTGVGDVDFSQQAMKAYVEVDTSAGAGNQTQVRNGSFIQEQSFTLTGSKGSRAFRFRQGDTVANMVQQIKTAADSTGIDAALVFNSDQRIDKTASGEMPAAAAEGPINQKIQIPGLQTATGQGISLFLSGDDAASGALRQALKDADIGNLSFNLKINSATSFDVIATDNTGDTFTLAENWSGASGALTLNVSSSNAAKSKVAAALQNMTLVANGGQVDAVRSASPESVNLTNAASTALKLENIYSNNAVAKAASYDQGTMTIDTNGIDWNMAYQAIAKTGNGSAFLNALLAGDIQTTASLSGAQDSFVTTISFIDKNTNEVYASESFTSAEIGVSAAAGTTTGAVAINRAGSVFNGVTVAVTEDASTKIGYQPGAALGTPTLSSGVPNVKFELVAKSTVGFSGVTAIDFTTPTTPITDANYKITGLVKSDGTTAVDLKITDAGAAAATDLLAALAGTGIDSKITFRVEPATKVAAAADVEKFNLIAIVGTGANAREYRLHAKDGWDGGAAALTVAAERKDGGGGDAADGLIIAALNKLAVQATDQISGAMTFGTPANWNVNFTQGASNNQFIVADKLYSTAAGDGQMTLDVGNINWAKVIQDIDLGTDPTLLGKFMDAAAAGTLKLDVTAAGATQSATVFTVKISDGTNDFAEATFSMADFAQSKGVTNGFVKINNKSGSDAWLGDIKVNLTDRAGDFGYNPKGQTLSGTPAAGTGAIATPTAAVNGNAMSKASQRINLNLDPNAAAKDQVGGISTDAADSAARDAGTVSVFNNGIAKDGSGVVEKGVRGVDISDVGAESVVFGMNTDGQGRIYIKFTGDNSFELYKDSSLSAESLVGAGINGREVREANNSGLKGLTLHLAGNDLASQRGVYLSMAGIEGMSSTVVDGKTQNGVVYNGDVIGTATKAATQADVDAGLAANVGESIGDYEGKAMFDAQRTLISGVELGRNTSDDGTIYLKNVYDAEKGTLQVFAYRHKDMRDADMVAKSEVYNTRQDNPDFDPNKAEDPILNPKYLDAASMTVVLNEVRNSDNTAGTGLGMFLSVDGAAFKGTKSATLEGRVTFTNLGARVFSQDYGSDQFVKITQDKGAIFTEYGTPGDNNSARLVDAGEKGITAQIFGQDATLSVNGMQIKTRGLQIKMATQDIQADFTFNGGKVGSTTLAQVGYGDGSIFTKIGALNLGNADLAATAGTKYEGLTGLLANAGHVTNERITNFQAGMQLQLGEGAGDQERTVVAIRSMTSENLGRVTKGGYWDTGSAVFTERTFSMKDVMGGGMASLSVDPILAMAIIDQAISDVSETRAQLGALQANLLQTNSNNLSVTMENIQRTESGIRDADMAYEMTEFTKEQVLQGAAMSMLSQANQASQSVLQLLR